MWLDWHQKCIDFGWIASTAVRKVDCVLKLSMVIVVVFVSLRVASAQEHAEGDHHEGLHFSHPLIAESVSPDTKVRIDYDFADLGQDASTHTLGLELEYAFHRAFSIEAGVPFRGLDLGDESGTSRLGNAEVALKFANYAFEHRGLLFGYGVEFGLPTGSEAAGIGSDHIVEFEPFFGSSQECMQAEEG